MIDHIVRIRKDIRISELNILVNEEVQAYINSKQGSDIYILDTDLDYVGNTPVYSVQG